MANAKAVVSRTLYVNNSIIDYSNYVMFSLTPHFSFHPHLLLPALVTSSLPFP